MAVTPLAGKPGRPLTLCGTGKRLSRGSGSFSVAFLLTFNENKQAGMGRRCGRIAWPGAGRRLLMAASAAEALQEAARSRAGAGSGAFTRAEAARGEKPLAASASGHCRSVGRAGGM